MKKYYKFIFITLFGLFIFLPKDTFAISFTESGYSCYYANSGEQICSNLTTFGFPNNQNGIGPLERLDYSVVTSEIRYIVVDFYNQSFCASEGTGGTFEGWIWFNEPRAVTNFNLNIRQGGNSFNCTTYVADEYGLGYKCVVPKSFNNATLTYELTPKGYDPYGSSSIFTFGIGTYTVGTQTCVVDSSLILENDNKNTDKIIQSNEEIKKEQEKTNEKLDEAEETRKGIWETIKDLPNKFLDMLKSLFIPEDDYFKNKFDELTDNITGVLGFLAYPFTLIVDTFEFFMTVEDTGSYIIKWPDIPVPNFEEHNIIEAGQYDLGQLLTNDKIAGLRNIAFVFINALLLLAFLQLCKNQYNRVFGGDVSETEFISVAEEYDIDYKTGEVSNIKHIEKKTTRRDIN